MSRPSLRFAGAAFATALVVAACSGGGNLSRTNAVDALESTGVSRAEATCMADTLLALGNIDAADPRRDRSTADQEALVSAMSRCVSHDGAPTVVVAGRQVTVEPDDNHISTQNDFDVGPAGQTGSVDGSELAAEQRTVAIEQLVRLGRPLEFSVCVVDQLIDVYADDVFKDPNFGVGLDPFEANAFASCSIDNS